MLTFLPVAQRSETARGKINLAGSPDGPYQLRIQILSLFNCLL